MEREPDPELPKDVVAAIRENRKVEAIQLLREHTGVDLAEAKRLVDMHAAKNPNILSGSDMQDQGSGLKLLGAIAIVVALYVAYRYLG